MLATLTFITPEEHAAALSELRAEFRGWLQDYVRSQNDWLTTAQALEAAGIRARSTLVGFARASAPDTQEPGRITYRKEGTTCLYARSSCIDYARTKRGQPALAA